MVLFDQYGQRSFLLAPSKQLLCNSKQRENVPSLRNNRGNSSPAFRLLLCLILLHRLSSTRLRELARHFYLSDNLPCSHMSWDKARPARDPRQISLTEEIERRDIVDCLRRQIYSVISEKPIHPTTWPRCSAIISHIIALFPK